MSELPFDLLEEVLVRVPLKDIIRFRCVSKRWRLLLQDESFISKHTTFAPSMFLVNNRDLRSQKNKSTNLRSSYVYKKDDRSDNANMIVQDRDLKYSDEEYYQANEVVGHCNGLLCLLLNNHTVVVWNPSLRESRTIPTLSKNYYFEFHVGFGYDHSIKDYKILLIPPYADYLRENVLPCQAEILTLTSSPRRFDFPSDIYLYNTDESKNGTRVGDYLFWQLANKRGYRNETILSFDIVSEKIGYSPSPCSSKNDGFVILTPFRGRLCMMQLLWVLPDNYHVIFNQTHVWCADHEEKDMSRIRSWNKLFTLELMDKIETPIRHGSMYGVLIDTVTKTGEFFLKVHCGTPYNIKLFAYNFEEKKVREIYNLDLCHFFDTKAMHEYEATLVSVHNKSNLKIAG